ncbi:hypothetical protein PQZ37_00765 [bacterium]|nr:hypothetical protein [bacterium]
MPAVTQLTPNFLGGVSTQNDDKKLLNQLTECVNGYPDPTFGLLKRPGMRHTNVLKKANGTAFSKSELAGAAWFYIDRASAGSYVGCIKGTDIFIWTAADGTFCTVTNTGASYLTGTAQNDYHFRSIQDTTIITNKTVTTAMQPAGTFVANSVATLKLLTLVNTYSYTVTIQNIEAEVTVQNNTTFDDMLLYDSGAVDTNHHLIDKIKSVIEAQQTASNADFAGIWYLEGYNNSIVIKRGTGTNAVVTDYSAVTGTPLQFEIDARGGLNNTALEVFEDDVTDVSKLSLESFTDHNVRVLNSDSAEDDYHVKFVAYDTTLNRGRGYWKETVARDASPGVNNTTMPHELANTGATAFTFGPISYKGRLTGNDLTSPVPSFIGSKISSTFFYSNRFGVLSGDNVILGVANDSYNFFVKSALTQIDSDPIDLNVSSVRPVTLSEVLPSPQGLILFSERQQFQLYATDASILTPTSAVIRALSNYEMATDIAPADIGTTSAFISRVPGYSKLFTMALRDVEQSPIVVDISKAVLEWIPDTVDGLSTSPPNSVVMLVDRDTSYLYLYRYYNNGKEDLFQAWTKWELPTSVQAAKIINDTILIVGQHEDEYTIGTVVLDEIPSGNVVTTLNGIVGNAPLDFATRPVKPDVSVDAVVYDVTNDITKVYVPYTPIADKEAAMLLAVPTADVGTPAVIDSDQGYYATATERTEIGTGYRYFEVKGDFSGYADGIVVGYNYDLEVILPKFYFRRDPNTTDYTATLTISRVKFSIGRTGAITFKIKATGSNEWKDVQHTAEADYYAGDTNPVVSERVFTIPVHQRNTNFELKVTSNFPFPVSLISMMWEGNYSPRFYKRA